MLDKNNTNQGYLCGRLFAVLDKIQEEAKKINSIRERYMNAASATPSAVFTTILNLSVHHLESLPNEGRKVFFEKLKQEIIDRYLQTVSLLTSTYKTKDDSLLVIIIKDRTSLQRATKRINKRKRQKNIND